MGGAAREIDHLMEETASDGGGGIAVEGGPAPALPPDRLDLNARVLELARLDELDYERQRQKEATALGVRVTCLDRAVGAARAAQCADDRHDRSPVENLEPWSKPVDGLQLAEIVRGALLAHVIFPSKADADAATLWLIGAYFMDTWRLWPKLLISSPEK